VETLDALVEDMSDPPAAADMLVFQEFMRRV
jgi:hypothetical protein